MNGNYDLLNRIEQGTKLSDLSVGQLDELCKELRSVMVETVKVNGGHLASGLGAVELIVALNRVFDPLTDRIVFDVGHQAYAHKILHGGADRFSTLRTEGGMSGFPKHGEHPADAFDTGHASTSVSAAIGLQRAAFNAGKKIRTAVVMGDGALTGGMAYEGLNDAGSSGLPMVIIINDNGMSISPSRGAMNRFLYSMRSSNGYLQLKERTVSRLEQSSIGHRLRMGISSFKDRIKRFLLPNTLFEELGFVYLGPVDGHCMEDLLFVLERAKGLNKPVIVHVVTKKGKGYIPAEQNPVEYHGVAPAGMRSSGESNSALFGRTLTSLAAEDRRIIAVTAAMREGTGLSRFSEAYPDRFFDVGIAEEHAVTMAAGMALGGARPVVAIYATFLQRAYDQILHDVCLQGLPVVFAVDRVGLVGEDGETHQGIYAPAFLGTIPGMTVLIPSDRQELSMMLSSALSGNRPAAVLYNRGTLPETVGGTPSETWWRVCRPVGRVTIVACGTMTEICLQAAESFEGVGLVAAGNLTSTDEEILGLLEKECDTVVIAEEFTDVLGKMLQVRLKRPRVIIRSVPNAPVFQGTVEQQRSRFGLTVLQIKGLIEEVI